MRIVALFIFWVGIGSTLQAQWAESAIELMNDTAHWLNHYTTLLAPIEWKEDNIHETAAIRSEIDIRQFRAIYTREPAPIIDLHLTSLDDSLLYIPGFAMDSKWENRIIHDQTPLTWNQDSLVFKLIYDTCDFSFPTQNPRITSPFGPRWGRNHNGLDLGLREGEPVFAAWEGMVRISHYSQSYGNVVVVRHANGLETLYAHMEARFVQPGQWVQNGDVVGLGGNTGRSYGAHLHFEIRYLGHAINPALILNVPKGYILQEDFIMSEKTFTKANTEKDEFSNEVRKSKTYKGRKYHTVRRGETLSSIARRHGTTVAKMAKLNKIRPSAKLRVGQKLRVK